jgi:hypothetical protein
MLGQSEAGGEIENIAPGSSWRAPDQNIVPVITDTFRDVDIDRDLQFGAKPLRSAQACPMRIMVGEHDQVPTFCRRLECLDAMSANDAPDRDAE